MLSASYILYYYQDILGVSAFAMGVILLAARVFDAFNDPIMGVVVAKTRTRWGKFRPWLFIGTILNAIMLYLMFLHRRHSMEAVWLCGSHLCTLGCDVHDDGYPLLVNDSGVYRGRQRA